MEVAHGEFYVVRLRINLHTHRASAARHDEWINDAVPLFAVFLFEFIRNGTSGHIFLDDFLGDFDGVELHWCGHVDALNDAFEVGGGRSRNNGIGWRLNLRNTQSAPHVADGKWDVTAETEHKVEQDD